MGHWWPHKKKNPQKIVFFPIFSKFGTQEVDKVTHFLREFA